MNYNKIIKQAKLFLIASELRIGDAVRIMDLNSSRFSIPELEKAYKAKVFELHPDRNPDEDTHDEFLLMNSAYKLLKEFNDNENKNPRDNHDTGIGPGVVGGDVIIKSSKIQNYNILTKEEIEKSGVVSKENIENFLNNEEKILKNISGVDDEYADAYAVGVLLMNGVDIGDAEGPMVWASDIVEGYPNYRSINAMNHLQYVASTQSVDIAKKFGEESKQKLRYILLSNSNTSSSSFNNKSNNKRKQLV